MLLVHIWLLSEELNEQLSTGAILWCSSPCQPGWMHKGGKLGGPVGERKRKIYGPWRLKSYCCGPHTYPCTRPHPSNFPQAVCSKRGRKSKDYIDSIIYCPLQKISAYYFSFISKSDLLGLSPTNAICQCFQLVLGMR